jgi:hypothetical protein
MFSINLRQPRCESYEQQKCLGGQETRADIPTLATSAKSWATATAALIVSGTLTTKVANWPCREITRRNPLLENQVVLEVEGGDGRHGDQTVGWRRTRFAKERSKKDVSSRGGY